MTTKGAGYIYSLSRRERGRFIRIMVTELQVQRYCSFPDFATLYPGYILDEVQEPTPTIFSSLWLLR